MQRRVMAIMLGVVSAALRPATAQQVADSNFEAANRRPAFPIGAGPRVCVDAGHNTFASATRNPGALEPLSALLRGDGFRVRELSGPYSTRALTDCALVVMADALADTNVRMWTLPHPSALTLEEISVLDAWVRAGGGLFVIADHTPGPGAIATLGERLGVLVVDGMAHRADSVADADVFARSRGEIVEHPIVRGRDASERVDSVATFTGHAFFTSREWSPLLRFGAGSVGLIPFPDRPRAEWPHFSVDGWAQAAARDLGQGRVVWLGEVSTCTALRGRTGMNHPAAGQNAQFCRNAVRWLARVL
jgi:hypothetical protein